MEKITCQECGKKVYRYPSAKFCFECIQKHEKKGERIRYARITKGFKRRCIFCLGKMEEIHHADLDKKNNKLNNRIPFCRRCHRILHSLIIKPILMGGATIRRWQKEHQQK